MFRGRDRLRGVSCACFSDSLSACFPVAQLGDLFSSVSFLCCLEGGGVVSRVVCAVFVGWVLVGAEGAF